MFAKYAFAALAAAACTAAQSSSCSNSGTTTIASSADATALSSCTTFSGSIAIATSASGDVALDGIQKITGTLFVNNATQLTSLSANSLKEISKFELSDLTILSTLNFPELSTVDEINWSGLPALSGLSFSTGVTMASSVNIQNTFLSSLDGINLKEVDSFFIANNNYLKDITVQFKSISQALTLSANGDNLSASFPNLEWAYNMTFRNVSTISTPSLASINGSLGFYGDAVKSYEAANLTTVGGSLSYVGNGNIANISLDALEKIGGGFQIADNPNLANASFPGLKTVGGALDFSGNLSSVTLASLSSVKGAFNIQSTDDITSDCSHFKSLSGSSNVIQGKFQCAGKQSNPGGASSTPSGTSSSTSASHTGAAGRLDMSSAAGLGFAGVLAAMIGAY